MEKFEHGGNIYRKAPHGGTWLDFSANINPLGLAPEVSAAIAQNIAGIVHYPDPEARQVKQAIGEHYGIAREQLSLGNGAAELFYLFLQVIRPQKVGLPVPSFSDYQRAAEAVGAELLFSPLPPESDFAVDFARLEQELGAVDCIFLGNPNNPTGQLLPREQLERFLMFTESRQIWTVVDESFLDFLPADNMYSVRDLTCQYKHLFVVRSLTKFYAMPGLRLGFASGQAALIERLEQAKDVWNVNSLAQVAGVAALGLKEYHKRSRAFVTTEKDWLYEQLLAIKGLKPLFPSVNFIMVNVEHTGLTSSELAANMRQQGVLVRDCANYTGLAGRQYIRVAVRSRAENEQMLKALEAVV